VTELKFKLQCCCVCVCICVCACVRVNHVRNSSGVAVCKYIMIYVCVHVCGVCVCVCVCQHQQGICEACQNYGRQKKLVAVDEDGQDYFDFCLEEYECGQCGMGETLMAGGHLLRCTACRQEVYCSRDCQKKHWATHKQVCKYLSGKDKLPL